MHYVVTGGFILLDLISGIIKALKNKDFTSSKMREGLFHKCASVLYMVFGSFVDYAQGFVDLGVTVPMAITVCVYICLMEIGSFIENLGEINPDLLPSKIKSHFKKLGGE